MYFSILEAEGSRLRCQQLGSSEVLSFGMQEATVLQLSFPCRHPFVHVYCWWFFLFLEQWSPNFLTPGTGFVEDTFSMDQVRGMICEIKRHLLLVGKAMTNLDSVLKSRDIILPTKVHLVKAMVFLVVLYGCERWTIKKADCQRIVVLPKTLESPLESKKIKPENPKGNQPWIFIGKTDAEDEAPILWSPDMKNWLIGKDPDAEKDWGQEEKGATEDEMVGWHHRLNGHELSKLL